MILRLLAACGAWAFLLGPLLVWATALLLDRLLRRARARRTRTQALAALAQLARAWEQAVDRVRSGSVADRAAAYGEALARTRAVHPLLADCVALPEAAFVAELLPRLAPADDAARAGALQLETIAALAPAVGLAGTVAGFADLFAQVARDGLANGLADLAGPGQLAMTTTLCGILCLGVALLALGLVRVDDANSQLRADLVRWHGAVRRSVTEVLP